ncbi:MAG: protein kinase [Oscillospiraceae bacterium]|nr:protein kinase [Oscillospiraceae bacterium]
MSLEMLKKVWPEWQTEEKPLGRGSYGVVYKAVRRDHNVESYAAIKVISIPSDNSEIDSLRSEGLDMNATRTYLQGIVNDFVSEIQLMVSMKGIQNIVSVEDYKVVEKTDDIGWDIYIRMELLTPFNTYICDKKLTEKEVIKLGCDICTALEICAKRNIIHRDIKPENIFINDFGYFKLGDFGIARKMENMTGGLSQKGTYNYMAPEVANSGDYDARVDIYSLGLVLYRLLNGNRLPFLDTDKQLLNPNDRRIAIDRRFRGEALLVPCDASPAMADLILRACAHNPGLRFASATEMRQALLAVSNGTYVPVGVPRGTVGGTDKKVEGTAATGVVRQVSSGGETKPEEKKEEKKNSKLPLILAVTLILAVIAGAAFLSIRGNEKTPEDGRDSVHTSDVASNGEPVPGSEEDPIGETIAEDLEAKKIAALIAEADAMANGGNYEVALIMMQNALETYPQSQEILDKVAEFTALRDAKIKEDALTGAASYAEAGDYAAAMELLESALKDYADDVELQTAYETYKQASQAVVKSTALAEAEALAREKKYSEAVKVLKDAIEINGEDADLAKKATEYETAYTEQVLVQAEAYLAEGNITAAKTLCRTAVEEFPGNEALTALYAKVNEYQVVALNTLTAINGGFEWNSGQAGDPFGNDYGSAQNYTIFHGYASYYSNNSSKCDKCDHNVGWSAEYKVDKAYDTLNMKVSPYMGYSQNGKSHFKVFVDGDLRYTSDIIVQKTQPYEISIDVSDATYLKVIAYVGENSCFMLSDVVLTTDPDFISTRGTGYTSLSQLDTFNGYVPWNSGYPENSRGDKYTNVSNFTILHAYSNYYDNGSRDCNDCTRTATYAAEYFVNSQYASVSFDIAPYSSFGANGTCYIKIYADDVLVYSCPAIGQKTAKFNTGKIDISGASYVKAVVEIGPGGCVILSDILLENK